MIRLMVLRVTANGAMRLAITIPRRGPDAGSLPGPLGEETTNSLPRASGRPFRAAANSEGLCRRAAGGNEARMGAFAPFGAARLIRQPGACGPWRGVR